MMKLLSFLTGNLTKPLLDAYQAKLSASNEADRLLADIEIRRLEALQQASEIRKATAGQWEMRLIVFVAGFPPAAHFAAVCLDSMFAIEGWTVQALPTPMNDWQGSIILSLFGLSALKVGASMFMRGRR